MQERSKKAKRLRLGDLRGSFPAASHQRPGPGGGGGGRAMSLPLPSYIPFDEVGPGDGIGAAGVRQQGWQLRGAAEGRFEGEAAAAAAAGGTGAGGVEALLQQRGETLEEYVLRRTREWNVAVRERPGEERLWLGFSEFQEDAARLMGRR